MRRCGVSPIREITRRGHHRVSLRCPNAAPSRKRSSMPIRCSPTMRCAGSAAESSCHHNDLSGDDLSRVADPRGFRTMPSWRDAGGSQAARILFERGQRPAAGLDGGSGRSRCSRARLRHPHRPDKHIRSFRRGKICSRTPASSASKHDSAKAAALRGKPAASMRTGSQLTRANSVIEFATYTTQRRGVMIDRCSAKSWTNGHPNSSSGWMVGQHFDECFWQPVRTRSGSGEPEPIRSQDARDPLSCRKLGLGPC